MPKIKPPILASKRLAQAIASLTKSALIDLVVDLARLEVGNHPSDERLAKVIQNWHSPVARARGERPPDFTKAIQCIDSIQHEEELRYSSILNRRDDICEDIEEQP